MVRFDRVLEEMVCVCIQIGTQSFVNLDILTLQLFLRPRRGFDRWRRRAKAMIDEAFLSFPANCR